MCLGTETVGQKLGKRNCFIGNVVYKVDDKVIGAEFPHYLTANTAGGERSGDDAILAAAYGDGGKFPVTVVNGLENGTAFGADGGGEGGVFDVAALIYSAVFAQQRRTDFIAGVGHIGVLHRLFGLFNEFFGCHKQLLKMQS